MRKGDGVMAVTLRKKDFISDSEGGGGQGLNGTAIKKKIII